MAGYISEHTRFMQEWLDKHPEALEEQRKSRELWWDRSEDQQARERYQAVRVPVKPYYYDVGH